MSPTAISRGERVYLIIGDGQSGVFELTRTTFLRAEQHPEKLGHRLSRIAPDRESAERLKLEIHIGTFTENNPRSLYAGPKAPHSCQGFTARWIPSSRVSEFSATMSKTSKRRCGI